MNRSDRWGGSPLDDAHRHRHSAVIRYLRDQGALTGSGNRATNLITAAAEGDIDEVMTLVHSSQNSRTRQKLDLNKGDYDKRTALHLGTVYSCFEQNVISHVPLVLYLGLSRFLLSFLMFTFLFLS